MMIMMGFSPWDMVPSFDLGWMHLVGALILMVILFLVRIALMRSFISDLAGEKFSYGLVLKRLLIVIIIAMVIGAGAGGLMYRLMSTNTATAGWMPIAVALLVALIISTVYVRMLNKFVHSKRKVLWILLRDYGVSAMLFFVLSLVGVAIGTYQTMQSPMASMMGANMFSGLIQIGDSGVSGSDGKTQHEEVEIEDSVDSVDAIVGQMKESVSEREIEPISNNSQENSIGDMSVSSGVVMDEENVVSIDDIVSEIADTPDKDDARSALISNGEKDPRKQASNLKKYIEDSVGKPVQQDTKNCIQRLFVGKNSEQTIGALMIVDPSTDRVYGVDLFVSGDDGSRSTKPYTIESGLLSGSNITQVLSIVRGAYDIETFQKERDITDVMSVCGILEVEMDDHYRKRVMHDAVILGGMDGITVDKESTAQ